MTAAARRVSAEMLAFWRARPGYLL